MAKNGGLVFRKFGELFFDFQSPVVGVLLRTGTLVYGVSYSGFSVEVETYWGD
jgi:hypothetical protein